MTATAERLKYLMKERRLRQVDILEMAKPYCEKYNVKLNKSDLSQFINGKSIPGKRKLFILGNALNVSEAWLIGFAVPMERTGEDTPNPKKDSERKELVRLFNGLSEENQKKVLDYVRVLSIAQQASDAHQE